MAIVEAGKHAPGMRPVPPVKTGTAHKLRKRFYPDGMWDRYCERKAEQDRVHRSQQNPNQKIRKTPPAPPRSSGTASTGPKFMRYPYTTGYCVLGGIALVVIGIVQSQPSALMLGVGMAAVPYAVTVADNGDRTEDSGPR